MANEKFFDASTTIEWAVPGAKIKGRLTGVKLALIFYLDDEELLEQLLMFFYNGTARTDVGKLLECIKAYQEKYGGGSGIKR